MFLILFQLALLLLTAWGWGFWLWKGLGFDRRPWRWSPWFCGLGGYALCMLVLQNLVYLNLRLAWTGWLGLLVAIAGVTCSVMRLRPAFQWSRCREAKRIAAVFLVVFCIQGCALFWAGPRNYYGFAHIDQINYVLLGQFLVEKPFSTSLSDVGLHPWLVPGIVLKADRIGQSVAHGYLAVVSLSDAKGAYGTFSIFLVAMAAGATYLLIRAFAAPRPLAGLAACWWGLLPAVGKLHLDGFLSHVSVLWVFPAIAALFCARRWRELDRRTIVLLAIYLAYLLCAYTEVYVLGVALAGGFLLLDRHHRLITRGAHGAAILLGSLLLAGGYLPYFYKFATLQYGRASSPSFLADLAPMSGSWVGWKQMFFGYGALHQALLERLLIFVAFGLVLAAGFAFQGGSRGKNRLLLALLLMPLAIMTFLLSAPVLPKYPFSKLLDTFTPFWVLLITLGIRHLGRAVFQSPRKAVRSVYVAMAVLIGMSFYGSLGLWGDVFKNRGNLWVVNSRKVRQCYAAAKGKGAGPFVIWEDNNLLTGWLAYHARGTETYVDTDRICHFPVPVSQFEFRHLPALPSQTTFLSHEGPVTLGNSATVAHIVVNNPQGADQDGRYIWWWVGKELQFEVEVLSFSKSLGAGNYEIQFDASTGPANADPARKLEMIGADGKPQEFDFTGVGKARFAVSLPAGKSIFTLRVVYPTEQIAAGPNDPRDLMVRIEHVSISGSTPPGPVGARP